MKHIEKSDLNTLQAIRGNNLLTIFIPLSKGIQGQKFNKSIFHEVRSRLKKMVSREQFAMLSDLLEKDLVALGYTNTSEGYVLFSDGEHSERYTLPFTPEETVYFGDTYLLQILSDYFATNTPYYVLAISSNGSKLFKGDKTTMEFVPLQGLGEDVETTLRIDEKQSHFLQNHPAGLGRTKQSKGFHGHGGLKDIRKTLFEEYVRRVDGIVMKAIHTTGAPLVLVAVEYGQSVYRHISKYPHILHQGLTTNPDDMPTHTLHKKILPMVYHRA